MLDGGVYFALESPTWTGGLALFDPDLPGRAAARAYLITAGQFSDIAAQEMRRQPGRELDLARALTDGRAQLGPGRYDTIIRAGTADGLPMLTFSAPWRAHEVAWNAPSARYLGILARGLHEAHGWLQTRTLAYLRELPGVARHAVGPVIEHAYRCGCDGWSPVDGEHHRQDRGCAGPAEFASGHGQGPAGGADVVDQQHRRAGQLGDPPGEVVG